MRAPVPLAVVVLLACGEAVVPEPALPPEASAAQSPHSGPSSPGGEPPAPLPPLSRACRAQAAGGFSNLARVGDDAVVWTRRLEPRGPQGYDPMSQLDALELRDRSTLALRWRRTLARGVSALAVSADGGRIAVGGSGHTLVIDARDGSEQARIDGAALQLAFGPGDMLAIAGRTGVSVHAPPSYGRARDLPVTGMAPTVIHAMRTDGVCDEIFDQTEARAVALAFAADGTLYAGVSDGSVRQLDARGRRFDLPGARGRLGYATQPVALAPRGRELVTVWNDGQIVALDARSLRARGTLRGACGPAERALYGQQPGRSCGAGRFADVRGDRIAMPGRVRALDGTPLLVAQTLHDDGVLQVGEELWQAGVSGTIERWAVVPGRPAGRFEGYLPIAGRSGWVRDVSPGGRYVAVASPPSAMPFARIGDARTELRVWDSETEREVVAVRGPGTNARFLDERRIAIQRPEPSRVEIVELASGRVLRALPLGGFEYAGLVELAGERLVLSTDDGRARVVDEGGDAIDVGFGAGVLTRAALEDDLLAALIFESSDGGRRMSHRLEVFSLEGGRARRLRRVDDVHRDALALAGGSVAFMRRGAPRLLDPRSGAQRPVPGAPANPRWLGRAGDGWLFRGDGPGDGLRREGRAFGPPILSPERIARVGETYLLYELGGAAYVIGPDGETRGSLASMDGGLVVLAATGHVSRSDGLTDALSSRDGEMLVPCEAAAHQRGLLRRLLR